MNFDKSFNYVPKNLILEKMGWKSLSITGEDSTKPYVPYDLFKKVNEETYGVAVSQSRVKLKIERLDGTMDSNFSWDVLADNLFDSLKLFLIVKVKSDETKTFVNASPNEFTPGSYSLTIVGVLATDNLNNFSTPISQNNLHTKDDNEAIGEKREELKHTEEEVLEFLNEQIKKYWLTDSQIDAYEEAITRLASKEYEGRNQDMKKLLKLLSKDNSLSINKIYSVIQENQPWHFMK